MEAVGPDDVSVGLVGEGRGGRLQGPRVLLVRLVCGRTGAACVVTGAVAVAPAEIAFAGDVGGNFNGHF